MSKRRKKRKNTKASPIALPLVAQEAQPDQSAQDIIIRKAEEEAPPSPKVPSSRRGEDWPEDFESFAKSLWNVLGDSEHAAAKKERKRVKKGLRSPDRTTRRSGISPRRRAVRHTGDADTRGLPILGPILDDRLDVLPRLVLRRVFLASALVGLVGLIAFVCVLSISKPQSTVLPRTEVHAPGIDRLVGVLGRFLNAPTWRDQLPCIRYPEQVKPKMESWYGRHPYEPCQSWSHEEFRYFTHHGAEFVDTEVNLGGGKKRRIVLELGKEGDCKVDWESANYFQETDWEIFQALRPQQGSVFRAVIEPGDYYNWAFSDPARFACWRIERPDGQGQLFAYTARNDRLSQQLMAASESRDPSGEAGQGRFAGMVELAYPPMTKDPQQVMLRAFTNVGWVVDYAKGPASLASASSTAPAPLASARHQ